MNYRSMISGLLAAALSAGLVVPLSAAGESSFSDIRDGETAVNGDILRLMGVVTGTGENLFSPNQLLTRGQFCAMVVSFMGMQDQVVLHSTRTIFSDVTASHWARGYVNLAASTMVEGGSQSTPEGDGDGSAPVASGTPIITGVGDGTFLPDQELSYAEAVTILIRVLGYSTDKVGAVWPASYLNLAQSIGLIDGLNLGPNDSINRAQTAQLFVNALTCQSGSGKKYYTTLGDVKENAIILAVNTETEDGSGMGAIRTSQGTFLPDAEGVAPTALVGMRGALITNSQNEIVTFVPDDSESKTVTLKENATPSYLMAGDTRYVIAPDTSVYTPDSAEAKPYSEAYSTLTGGTRLTLFIQRGKIVAIYSGAASASPNGQAMVVMGRLNAASLHDLTGGATNYTIVKNQQVIPISALQEYDVLTYDSMTNTIIASDLRMTCRYQNAAPNSSTPQSIQLLGHTFPVLQSAWAYTNQVKLGQMVSLLMTADGRVAAILPATGDTRSTALGMVTGATSVELFLPNGTTLKLSGSSSDLSTVSTVCTISALDSDKLAASPLGERKAPGNFDSTAMTLGSLTVTPSVRVYERVSGGSMVPVSLSSLGHQPVPVEHISTYHQNSSGIVDLIVLDSYTGDAYTYGKLKMYDGGDNGGVIVPRYLAVENGSGGLAKTATGMAFQDGAFGGAVLGPDGKVASIVNLRALKDVSADQFQEQDGKFYLTYKGKTYPVADGVECYQSALRAWMTGETGADRMRAALAESSTMTVYYDAMGEKVRVVALP